MAKRATYYEGGNVGFQTSRAVDVISSSTLSITGNGQNRFIKNQDGFEIPQACGIESQTYESVYQAYRNASSLIFPDLSDIVPSLVDEFVKPVWSGVSDSVSSSLSLLPGISPFPLSYTPPVWLSGRGFLVCRNMIGKWVAVDPVHLSKSNAKGRENEKLSKFLATVNAFPSRGSSSICFDNEFVYFVESDFCSDNLFIYVYNEECEKLQVVCSLQSLPCGALHVYGVHRNRLIYSIASSIYIVDLRDEALATTAVKLALYQPAASSIVSIQHVAPFISDIGDVYYLSNGGLWKQSTLAPDLPAQCLFDAYTCVSISADLSRKILAVLSSDLAQTYITLYDYHCGFVVSTSAIHFGPPLSVVSMSIDPVTLEVVLVARSHSARTGALVKAFTPTWN